MRKALYDMLYLVICGIQQVKPQQSYVDTIDWGKLYKVSRGFVKGSSKKCTV